MKRKLNITAILMACFLLLFFQHSAQAESTETVSVEKAIEAIQNIHENMPQSEKEELGWGEIELNHMLDLYDINDDIVAYYFQVIEQGVQVGYFIQSARTDIEPIIEFGNTPYGHEIEMMEQPKANDKLYYFGANNFVYASNKSEVRNMFNENIQEKVQLLSKQLSNSVLSRVENNELEGKIKQLKNIKIEDLSLKRSKKNEELWSSILETSDYNNEQEDLVTALNYPSSGRIDGWTHMWQGQSGVNGPGSACGPATAAMILDYMHYRFDSNIRNVNTYGSQSAFINALRYYLGTQSWGTTYPMFAERLQQILNTDSNGWNVVRVNGPGGGGSATYMHDRFKDRIIAQRPPAVYWHTWSVFDDPMIETEYHWQMGFAYWRQSGSDMIRVVEPAWQNTHVRNYNFNTQSPYFHLVIIGGAPS